MRSVLFRMMTCVAVVGAFALSTSAAKANIFLQCLYPVKDGDNVLFRKVYFEMHTQSDKYYKYRKTWRLGEDCKPEKLERLKTDMGRDAHTLVLVDKNGFSNHIRRKHLDLQVRTGYKDFIVAPGQRLVFEGQCFEVDYPSKNRI